MSNNTETDLMKQAVALVRLLYKAPEATSAADVLRSRELRYLLRTLQKTGALDDVAASHILTLTEVDAYFDTRWKDLSNAVTQFERERFLIQQWKLQLDKQCKSLAKQVRDLPKLRLPDDV